MKNVFFLYVYGERSERSKCLQSVEVCFSDYILDTSEWSTSWKEKTIRACEHVFIRKYKPFLTVLLSHICRLKSNYIDFTLL